MTGNGSGPVYTVEARVTEGGAPLQFGDFIVSEKWQRLPIATVPEGHGIPNDTISVQAREAGYLSHSAAMSLGWWFIAAANWGEVEVRLVEYQFEYSFAATRQVESEPFSRLYGRLTAAGVKNAE